MLSLIIHRKLSKERTQIKTMNKKTKSTLMGIICFVKMLGIWSELESILFFLLFFLMISSHSLSIPSHIFREKEAIDFFVRNGQAWRAALMFGSHLPSDFYLDGNQNKGSIKEEQSQNLEETGNAYCNLFKKTLNSILSEPSSNLNKYERAIMGTQAAHLKSILGACNTWEDFLWAHYFVKHDAQSNLVWLCLSLFIIRFLSFKFDLI